MPARRTTKHAPKQTAFALGLIAKPTVRPSRYQEDIYRFVEGGTGDGFIVAAAGSGKTTTLVEAAQLVRADKAIFLAFNKHIARELEHRLHNSEIAVMTIHKLGMRTIGKHLGQDASIERRKYRALARDWVEMRFERIPQAQDVTPSTQRLHRPHVDHEPLIAPTQLQDWKQVLTDLVSFVRLTLTDPSDADALRALARRFGLPFVPALLPGVGEVLDQGVRLAEQRGIIDFTDMLWLPTRLDLKPERYRHLFVDEAQDLSAAQLALVLKARARGGRILFCGDPRQSIMAFAGADPAAFEHIKQQTQAVELPLSLCYRCPRSHLELARRLVPSIETRPDAPEGTVTVIPDEALEQHVRPGDLIICRKTAPLVAWCIRLISQRITARVRGREMAGELTSIACQLGRLVPWSRFGEAIDVYEDIQVAQLVRDDAEPEQIVALHDRCAALKTCYRSFRARSVDELCAEIDALFSDERPTVWLSTIHRAKGLEAERVFLLEANTLPLSWPRQRPEAALQEQNLLYIALTRSKDALFLVLAPDEPFTDERVETTPRSDQGIAQPSRWWLPSQA